jgi:hypothetical protein
MTTTTTTTVRALSATEVAYLRDRLAGDLGRAERGLRDEAQPGERLYWASRVDALEGALHALDVLCGGAPWPEP